MKIQITIIKINIGTKYDSDVQSIIGIKTDGIVEEVLNYIDTLVDGQYVDELRDPTLKWKGSSNQRVIDVQKSLKQNNIVLIN